MNHVILFENQKRRLYFSIGLLICFAMYSAWQMGYIYFMGPSLVIEGKTPLPISMDNITILIVLNQVINVNPYKILVTIIFSATVACAVAVYEAMNK